MLYFKYFFFYTLCAFKFCINAYQYLQFTDNEFPTRTEETVFDINIHVLQDKSFSMIWHAQSVDK